MDSTKQLILNPYRLNNAERFVDSFTATPNTVYFVFAGKTTSYANTDTVVPAVDDTLVNGLFDAYQQMVFGKHVRPQDVAFVVTRRDWVSGTVYDMYDDQVESLEDKAFFVCVQEDDTRYVYKCLDNAGGTPSTSQPTFSDTSAADSYYRTGDGYLWKYMYQIDSGDFATFSTPDFIPVVEDPDVTANAVSGAIDVIRVDKGGSGYNNYVSGQFNVDDIQSGANDVVYGISSSALSANHVYDGCWLVVTSGLGAGEYRTVTDYFVNTSGKFVVVDTAFDETPAATSTYEVSPKVFIQGDGHQTSQAAARALVNAASGNAVWGIEMLDRGAGYHRASAQVLVSGTVGVTNAAALTVICGPKGGHGASSTRELYCSAVEVSVTFANTESNTISTDNDFRVVGLVRDPLWSNVTVTTANQSGNFEIGEAVTQANTGASGIVSGTSGGIVLTDVEGFFAPGNSTFGTISGNTSGATAQANLVFNNGFQKGFETFSGLYRYTGQLESGSFSNDEVVTLGNTATTNAVFHSFQNSTVMCLTQQLGDFTVPNTILGTLHGGHFSVTSRLDPDVVVGSGDVMYLENLSPVSRSNTKSETIRLVLEF